MISQQPKGHTRKVNACKNTSIGGIIIPHTGMFNCSTDIGTESSQRRDCVLNHVVKSS